MTDSDSQTLGWVCGGGGGGGDGVCAHVSPHVYLGLHTAYLGVCTLTKKLDCEGRGRGIMAVSLRLF